MVTNGNLGDIRYTYLRSDDETLARNPLGVLKSKWNDLDFNKIYLAKIVCGSDYIALIQKYSSHLHGSVAIFSYEKVNPIYARLNSGTWTDSTLITNTDLQTAIATGDTVKKCADATIDSQTRRFLVSNPSDAPTYTSNRALLTITKYATFTFLTLHSTSNELFSAFIYEKDTISPGIWVRVK